MKNKTEARFYTIMYSTVNLETNTFYIPHSDIPGIKADKMPPPLKVVSKEGADQREAELLEVIKLIMPIAKTCEKAETLTFDERKALATAKEKLAALGVKNDLREYAIKSIEQGEK